ncbi:uncharacterized protein LOC142486186 [Ascaphus truei]|uniref:uncharacterized protein LOC142486186 n=1 Tax=Ascaphus truei TaxID=8439 RepID=UPI003F595E43
MAAEARLDAFRRDDVFFISFFQDVLTHIPNLRNELHHRVLLTHMPIFLLLLGRLPRQAPLWAALQAPLIFQGSRFISPSFGGGVFLLLPASSRHPPGFLLASSRLPPGITPCKSHQHGCVTSNGATLPPGDLPGSDAARTTTPSGSRSRHPLNNALSGNPLNTAWTTTYLHSPLPDFGEASFTLSLQPVPGSPLTESLIEPPVLKQGYPENLTCWWPLRTGVGRPCSSASVFTSLLFPYLYTEPLCAWVLLHVITFCHNQLTVDLQGVQRSLASNLWLG